MPRTKDFNETEVLEKALRTFWCKGYEATTTRDLAQASGISYGSLYHAYRDKRTLFLAALDYYQQRYVFPFLDMFKVDGSPKEIIRQFLLEGRLQVVARHAFPLAEAAAAHRAIENRQTTGKVVLLP